MEHASRSPIELGHSFEQGLQLLRQSGVEIRYEYFHGSGGGLCQVRDRPQLFVDVAQDPREQWQDLRIAVQQMLSEEWPVTSRGELEAWLQRA